MCHDANLSDRSEAVWHAQSSIRGLRARHRPEPETRSVPGSHSLPRAIHKLDSATKS